VELILNLLIILVSLPLALFGIYFSITFFQYFGIKMITITSY